MPVQLLVGMQRPVWLPLLGSSCQRTFHAGLTRLGACAIALPPRSLCLPCRLQRPVPQAVQAKKTSKQRRTWSK